MLGGYGVLLSGDCRQRLNDLRRREASTVRASVRAGHHRGWRCHLADAPPDAGDTRPPLPACMSSDLRMGEEVAAGLEGIAALGLPRAKERVGDHERRGARGRAGAATDLALDDQVPQAA